MVDRYYRKIESVENKIENSIQISGILLKLKEHDDDFLNIKNNSVNKNEINSLSDLIDINKNKLNEIESYILDLNKNFENKYDIDKQILNFSSDKHFYSILDEEITY